MSFRPGDAVEYDSAYDAKVGAITSTGQKSVIRGVYVRRVSEDYSDVSSGGRKPLLVRTSRLRSASGGSNGGGEAA